MELEIMMGSEWLQKVIVISHERSGTHFLMNTLAQNFGYVSNDWIDLDSNLPINYWNPPNTIEILSITKGKPIATLFKAHYSVEFFLPILRELLDEFFIFYIYRNGNDVMESFCRHVKDLLKPPYAWFAGPECVDGKEFAAAEPCGGMLRYQWRQYPNCYARWEAHVDGWMNDVPLSLRNRLVHVKYEDLNNDFPGTVRNIANRLGLTPPDHPVRPTKFDNVIEPESILNK